jgi:hypothetical protein
MSSKTFWILNLSSVLFIAIMVGTAIHYADKSDKETREKISSATEECAKKGGTYFRQEDKCLQIKEIK